VNVLYVATSRTANAGELRSRSERMHRFEELSDVQSTLQRLIEWDPALVKMLPSWQARKRRATCTDLVELVNNYLASAGQK
jgi:uncharacterized protein YceH (UPF0502 family)